MNRGVDFAVMYANRVFHIQTGIEEKSINQKSFETRRLIFSVLK